MSDEELSIKLKALREMVALKDRAILSLLKQKFKHKKCYWKPYTDTNVFFREKTFFKYDLFVPGLRTFFNGNGEVSMKEEKDILTVYTTRIPGIRDKIAGIVDSTEPRRFVNSLHMTMFGTNGASLDEGAKLKLVTSKIKNELRKYPNFSLLNGYTIRTVELECRTTEADTLAKLTWYLDRYGIQVNGAFGEDFTEKLPVIIDYFADTCAPNWIPL